MNYKSERSRTTGPQMLAPLPPLAPYQRCKGGSRVPRQSKVGPRLRQIRGHRRQLEDEGILSVHATWLVKGSHRTLSFDMNQRY
jgi:hypothetical protein